MQKPSGAKQVAWLSLMNFHYFLSTQNFMSGGKVIISDIIYFSLGGLPLDSTGTGPSKLQMQSHYFK